MELVRRDAWGAAPPRGKPVAVAVPVKDLFLHHSAGPDNGLDSVRAIQKFHQQSRGWADIAYTWLYSPKLRVFIEGRGPGIQQAAQRGHNRTGHSVCVLGNFDASTPARHVADDLADWARWHGGTWGPDHYRPHRDVNATACPGRHLNDLIPTINTRAATAHPPVQPGDDLPPTLRLGSTGDDVTLLQAAVLSPDGVFGPVTDLAVREYQRANGLTVDGICGPQTWRSILGL
jgi:peptidoglycan hydrolase-like protein with peptidoglycan-binding domain